MAMNYIDLHDKTPGQWYQLPDNVKGKTGYLTMLPEESYEYIITYTAKDSAVDPATINEPGIVFPVQGLAFDSKEVHYIRVGKSVPAKLKIAYK